MSTLNDLLLSIGSRFCRSKLMPFLAKSSLTKFVLLQLQERLPRTSIRLHRLDRSQFQNTMMTSRLLGRVGHYTGRLILLYVNDGNELENLGLKMINSNNCEELFRKWLDDTGFSNLEHYVKDDQTDHERYNTIFRTLGHEYAHWLIVKETSIAAVVDAISWRVRFDQMYFCEKIHETTMLPRLLDDESIVTIKKNYLDLEKELIRIAENNSMQKVFKDLCTHHYYLLYYQTVLAIIIEPITWVICEPGWIKDRNSHLESYFGDVHEWSYQKASELMDVCLRFKEVQKEDGNKKLITAANLALNFPFDEAELKASIGDNYAFELVSFIIERFKDALEGKTVSTASQTDKSFASVLSYAIRIGQRDEISDDLIKILSSIASRDPELISFALQIVQRWMKKSAFGWPAIFINTKFDGSVKKIRYDPLTQLTSQNSQDSAIDKVVVRETKRTINKIDDCVGDLPHTLGSSLFLLFSYQDPERLNDLIKLLYTGNDNQNVGNITPKEKIRDILIYIKNSNLSYEDLVVSGDLHSFMKFWLYCLNILGQDANNLFVEHGMGI